MNNYEFMEKLTEAIEEGGSIHDLVDDYVFLRKVRVEKTGTEVRIFCAETDRELVHGDKVKLDLSRGEHATAKLTLDVAIENIVIQEKQMNLIDGLGSTLKEGESMTLSTGGTSATIHGRNKNKN